MLMLLHFLFKYTVGHRPLYAFTSEFLSLLSRYWEVTRKLQRAPCSMLLMR